MEERVKTPNCDDEAKGLMKCLMEILVELWIVPKCGVDMLTCLSNECFVYLVEVFNERVVIVI